METDMRYFDRDKLKKIMADHGDSASSLAAALVLMAHRHDQKIGTTPLTVQNWIDGQNEPTAFYLGLLATHYKLKKLEADLFSGAVA